MAHDELITSTRMSTHSQRRTGSDLIHKAPPRFTRFCIEVTAGSCAGFAQAAAHSSYSRHPGALPVLVRGLLELARWRLGSQQQWTLRHNP